MDLLGSHGQECEKRNRPPRSASPARFPRTARKNFLQAVRVAASDAARGKGALVVTQRHHHRGARGHQGDGATASKPTACKISACSALVDDYWVTFYRQPGFASTLRPRRSTSAALQKLPRVDIVSTTYRGRRLRARRSRGPSAAGPKGWFVAAFPTGPAQPGDGAGASPARRQGDPNCCTPQLRRHGRARAIRRARAADAKRYPLKKKKKKKEGGHPALACPHVRAARRRRAAAYLRRVLIASSGVRAVDPG